MKRRELLAAAALAGALPRPSIAGESAARTLRFIPEGNLANPDPIWTTTTVARNHGFLIYDTLFGVDKTLAPKPQMAEGFELSDDKLVWTFRLRDGLRFHDGAPVRGADCIASISRWSKRDGFGQRLAAQLDGMSVPDDRSFTVRLKKPFPLLTAALAKPAANVCFIMPERVAQTDAFTQITDFTGSGPFRFLRDEWTPGSLAAYARFDGYVPRQEAADFTAGGKAVHFDRVEWNIIPDSATAAAAVQTGEEDWWQTPIAGPRSLDMAKRLVSEAGYKGERVVIISPTDYPWLEAFCQVTRDLLLQLGLNVDYQASDWGTVVQRRASKEPVEKGGWSIFCTGWEGLNTADPGGHYPVLGNGGSAWFGWPTSPRIEQLRTEWFDAPDDAARRQATDAIQAAVWEEAPYVPLGQFFQPAAMRDNVQGVLDSPFPIFWNATKA